MVKTPPIFTHPYTPPKGFALVLALALVSLLLLLTVTFMSLTRSETEAYENSNAEVEARQNAITAAKMAIGQLQQLTGSDTRITASSKILDDNNVPLTGVWRSWEASDRVHPDNANAPIAYTSDLNGMPLTPNYDSKFEQGDRNIATQSDYLDGRFLGWLTSANISPTSGDDATSGTADGENSLAHAPSEGLVPMIYEGSVDISSNPTEAVFLLPTPLETNNTTTGSLAWWTTGNNSKAKINIDISEEPTSGDITAWTQRLKSFGRPDPSVFGLGWIDDQDDLPTFANLSTLNFEYDSASDFDQTPLNFHDITTISTGLLTNTATGGWRKDLSLMTESYDGDNASVDEDPASKSTGYTLPSTGLPFYTASPGEIIYSQKADGTDIENTLIYPWTGYRVGAISSRNNAGPISSWTALVDYATQYKDITSYSSSGSTYPLIDSWFGWARPDHSTDKFIKNEKIRFAPILSRVYITYSLTARIGTGGDHVPQLLVTPNVQIWNPYNVTMEIDSSRTLMVKLDSKVLPISFDYTIDSGAKIDRRLEKIHEQAEGSNDDLYIEIPMTETIVLQPGENRIFGPGDGIIEQYADITDSKVPLGEGVGINGGFALDFENGIPEYDGTADFQITAVEYDFPSGGSFYQDFNFLVNRNEVAIYKNGFTRSDLASDSDESRIYPTLSSTDLSAPSRTLDTLVGSSQPFMTVVWGNRITTPLHPVDETEYAYRFSKGYAQSSPLNYGSKMGTEFGDKEDYEDMGLHHPINSVYELSYRPINSWSSADGWVQPQTTPGDNLEGFMFTGLDAASSGNAFSGVVAEIPTRPIQSLVDLTHWDARNNNPIPPYQFNILGNSTANPIFQPDTIFKNPTDLGSELMYFCNDDSYYMNHIFFDDWFVSSIAPDFGASGTSQQRSINTVYSDHLEKTTPLPNYFYQPSSDAALPDIATAADNITENTPSGSDPYPFETVASQLEVDGMFNVNSTSVEAWKALLRQAKGKSIPYVTETGSINLESNDNSSFPYPRTTIAGGVQADGSAALQDEIAGYRLLSEEQIDALANEIVSQIKLRGPFLSLSEFVNRQLVDDSGPESLALAGAI
ncbi:MAG: hypothetical protein ACPGN3_15315 [Opitutales bacterium]